jgi:hypothetical protein
MYMNKNLVLVMLLFLATVSAQAQVTIGSKKIPSPFSILELISGSESNNGNRGLRLPQLTNAQRTIMQETQGFQNAKNDNAVGLRIFNTNTRCVETWNGTNWIQSCGKDGPANWEIPEAQPFWTDTKWVGAFWKDDQTGERIIASKNTEGIAWSAEVDAPSGAGAWLTLQTGGGHDPALWTDAPHDAEDYQLPATQVTTVSGTGDILFRIGALSTNPNATDAAYKYPDNSDGKPPRYATVTLTVDGQDYTLYCRQGEAADFVFTTEDTYNDPNTGDISIPRTKARKFSPYNLTNMDISETTLSAATGVATAPDSYKGKFVDFPTQAGAFFQWGMNDNITYAYHPTQSAFGAVDGWSTNISIDYWDNIKDIQETCPSGWRRPNDGITDGAQAIAEGTDDYTANNIYNSEMRQSLYAVPKNGTAQMTETTGRAWGYYADGYFDRCLIVDSPGANKSTVSQDTKDIAYIGTLFFNSANDNRSLFMPVAGFYDHDLGLYDAGQIGKYWSSSSAAPSNGLMLYVNNNYVYQYEVPRVHAVAVRCVAE